MSQKKWGPPIWCFFHTMAEKIKAEHFSIIFPSFFNFIRRICNSLPCPDCSLHASSFLKRINYKSIKTKQDLINILYIFHNSVNKRKSKPLFHVSNMTSYSSNNLIQSYNGFISAYTTRGNIKLIADSFQRNLVIKDLKSWLMRNIEYFDIS